MSEEQETGAGDVLEQNIDKLMRRASSDTSDRPRLDDLARARILGGIKRELATRRAEPAKEPASAGATVTRLGGRRRPLVIVSIALAVAACVALVWTQFRPAATGRQGGAPGDSIALHQADAAGLETRTVDLADGTRVILRPGAAIEELGPRRLRLVRGDALLDVAKAPERAPFVVESAHGRAVVLGTRFVMSAAEDRASAAVLRGRVRLESGGGGLLLRAGEHGLIEPEASPRKLPATRVSHEVEWAREALAATDDGPAPIRRGNLLARNPNWGGDWPLPLRAMKLDIYIEDGVARTTVDQTFFNPSYSQLEGVYSFPLPPEAALSRLAMYVDGRLMEGGVIERQRGRDVYESIVHRRRDPALLEWMQGNNFRVRVFPLPGRTEKRVLMSYTRRLDNLYGGYRARVPIPALDQPVDQVTFTVRVADGERWELGSSSHHLELSTLDGARVGTWSADDVELGRDLELELRPRANAAARRASATRRELAPKDKAGEGALWMVRARPELPQRSSERAPRRWVVLHDTSASRGASELRAQQRLLLRLLGELDEQDEFTILAFDRSRRLMGEGFTRVDQASAEDVRRFLERESAARVGDTDLSAAIEQALMMLEGASRPDGAAMEPHVLYLGDGMLTPAGAGAEARREELAALREQLAGKASFVAVSVGDPVDAPGLQSLADASGGLYVALPTGADLAWSALELVATLNTSRALELTASLLGADGQPLAGAELLRSRASLSDGEELVVLARAPKDAEPRAVELSGTVDGAPWSTRLELARSESGGDAGYLPRLWAQARIDALLDPAREDMSKLAGDEEGDAAERARREVTELGLAHFLVTPYTSLLVLEREQQYRRFDVHRPPADAWARYDAPAEWTPKRAAQRWVEWTPGEHVVRRPAPILHYPSAPQAWYQYPYSGAFGLGGLGVVGAGFGARGIPTRSTRSTGDVFGLGLVGTGRGGGGVGEGVIGLDVTGASAVSDDLNSAVFAEDQTMVAEAGIPSGSHHADVFKRAAPRQQQQARAAGESGAWTSGLIGPIGGGFAVSRGGPVPSVSSLTPWPVGYLYVGDPALDDLSELAPALFEDGFDIARERLLASPLREGAAGTIDAGARELLTAGRRRSIAALTVRAEDGATLTLDGLGGFVRSRQTARKIAERVRYDGEELVASYPELGLAVRRHVGPTEPALLSVWAPWVLPRAETLTRWYDVSSPAPRVLRLTPRAGEGRWIEFELDAEDRVVETRRRAEDGEVTRARFEYTGDAITIVAGETRARYTILRDGADARAPSAAALADAKRWTVVELPMRSDEAWQRALTELRPGEEAWRHAQRQRLATLAASRHAPHLVWPIVQALRDANEGETTLGELVLASRALSASPAALRGGALTKSLPEGHVVRDYVEASLSYWKRYRGTAFKAVAAAHAGTGIGELAAYRALIDQINYRPRSARSLAALEEFFAAYPESSELAYAATHRLAQVQSWRSPKRAVAAWEALSEARPEWTVVALRSAADALQSRGKHQDAVALYERMLTAARERGDAVWIDWRTKGAFTQARGEAGWRVLWTRLRADAVASKDPERVAWMVHAALQVGEHDEVHRLLAAIDADALARGSARSLVTALVGYNLAREASPLLRGQLERAPDDLELRLLAASAAESLGQLEQAAEHLSRYLELRAEDAVTLSELRGIYTRLFSLHERLAQGVGVDAADREHRDAALELAARWRAEDPDNADIDERCASLLFALGEAEEAGRYLASVQERHPGEGSAHARVAELLTREAQDAAADDAWRRAIAVEPTNPTWRLRRAQTLLARGEQEAARAELDAIVGGRWQDRFAGIVSQARALRRG